MGRFALLGVACLIVSSSRGFAETLPRNLRPGVALAQLAGDTTVRLRFDIPSKALPEALAEYSRHTGVQLEVDIGAASGATSHSLVGTFMAAHGLRQLLAGTGLTARFVDGERARVTRAGTDVVVHTLTPLTVFGTRNRGYVAARIASATKTDMPLRDVPQSVSVVTSQLIADQSMQGMADVIRYLPGVAMGQGEGHRDAPTIRGNSSTADFFVDGMRDDAQYHRDVYNTDRVEALKGPNALTFGRGGAGGVLNRVSKAALWARTRNLAVGAGSFEHKRATLDIGDGITPVIAARFNGVYEQSGGFRDAAEMKRYGLNPTLAAALGARTTVRAGYEHFTDDRRVDRGIPSFQGRPSSADPTTFFGNPAVNRATMEVNGATASVEHFSGGLTIRNRTRFADYAKFYQNSLPGAVNAAGTEVELTAYNQRIGRRNLFNQTDVILDANTGAMRHTLLLGGEAGWQESRTRRETGYYNNSATSFPVPFDQPTVGTPITFRPSASDADNRTRATVTGLYVQDRLALSAQWQAIVGVRFDRFRLDVHNYRTGEDLERDDDLISPRLGLVFKPTEALSLYGSYSVSHLPSSGDQFSSLSATTQTLEPEHFTNYELGAKWDARPNLSVTAAVYRLDRTNTVAPHPIDAARLVQTGSQRTRGFELGASGNITAQWQLAGGATWQDAAVTSTTSNALEGATVPLVPERTLSLWNRYQLLRSVGIGFGVIHQSDMFAAIDNTVTLPGFTRADGALFVQLHPQVSAQLNIENLFDERYYATSHGNNNIMPGAPRALRVSLTTRH